MLIRKGNFVTVAQTLLVLRITLDDHVANGFRKYIYACDLISTVQNTEISFNFLVWLWKCVVSARENYVKFRYFMQ